MAVNGNEQIAPPQHTTQANVLRPGDQTGFIARAALYDAGYVRTCGLFEAECIDLIQGKFVARTNAHVGIIIFTILDNLGRHALDNIDRDGKPDSRVDWFPTGVGSIGTDGAVNADHFAAQVEQWAAGIAGADGRIRLDLVAGAEEVAAAPSTICRQGTCQSRDDARGH